MSVHQIAAARLWAVTRYPYLASAIFAVSVHEAEGLGGIQVDEWWRVHLDPLVVSSWQVEQLGGELMHLTSHLLRDHAARARTIGLSSEEELVHWVDSVDAEIADDLPADLPRGRAGLRAEALGCRDGCLAEEYYRTGTPLRVSSPGVLPADPLHDCGSGAHGRTGAWEPPPPHQGGGGIDREQQDLLRQQVAVELLGDGSAPEGMRRWAEAWRRPAVDWRTELAAELRHGVTTLRGAVDYSYSRPSRRAAALRDQGHGSVVLPSMRDPLVEIAVVCDTSASVSDVLLGQALAEIDAMLHSVGVGRVQVLACDHAIQASCQVRRVEDLVLFGGGGTDMGVGLDAAIERRPRPNVIVVLTDGFTPWPDRGPDGCRVVVGLLESEDALLGAVPPRPDWVRTVSISSSTSGRDHALD